MRDAELFLPKKWSDDRPRCREAGIPDSVVYRPKWEIALEQLDRAKSNGVVLDWTTFDEGYGKDPGFLSRLEEAGERYLGEVPKSVRVWLQRPVVEEPGRGSTGRPRHKPRVRADQ